MIELNLAPESDMRKKIKELETKLSESDRMRCEETAKLMEYYNGVTYEGAYITALMQKINSNTGK